jgi:cyd operon protein YbgT
MWYFTWVLGLGLAVSFGVLNGLWHEFNHPAEEGDEVRAEFRQH